MHDSNALLLPFFTKTIATRAVSRNNQRDFGLYIVPEYEIMKTSYTLGIYVQKMQI